MATATKSGQNLSFTYNADGLRTTKTVNGVVHTYYYSGSKLVRETYGDYVLDFFYDQNGTPFMLLQNGNIYYYITNAQGDVIRLVDINGNVAASYRYDPYGKATSALGSHANINPLRYRGYVFDHETGLYYLQSRYYDPETGRFLNADAFASTGQGLLGNNMFAYCNNNPANYADPFGYYLQKYATRAAFDNYAYSIIKHDVPLYKQGDRNLCWAYCQTMLEDYQSGTVSTQEEADQKAKKLAISVHGEGYRRGKEKWDRSAWPTNRGKSLPISGISLLYNLLKDGPVYAYYWNGKPRGKAHLVLVTGVDVSKGIVYTNNPWGYSGAQTYGEFLNGVLGGSGNEDMPLCSIIPIN